MATLFVDKIDPQSGTTLSLGSSGDTLQATAGTTNNLGISMADQWRLSADTNNGVEGDVTSNWERNDNSSYSSIGTGLTESSGVFSFPTTGIYYINATGNIASAASDGSIVYQLVTTIDNSTYPTAIDLRTGNPSASTTICSASGSYLFDVTDISLCKFKFFTSSFNSGTALRGSTSQNRTHFTVIRLGDT